MKQARPGPQPQSPALFCPGHAAVRPGRSPPNTPPPADPAAAIPACSGAGPKAASTCRHQHPACTPPALRQPAASTQSRALPARSLPGGHPQEQGSAPQPPQRPPTPLPSPQPSGRPLRAAPGSPSLPLAAPQAGARLAAGRSPAWTP